MSDFPDFTLTRVQRNDVFGWLNRRNFDPADFEWQETESVEKLRVRTSRALISRLVHKSTGYYFDFGRLYNRFVPGMREKIAAEEHYADWGIQASTFNLWSMRLREEVDAPDLWASVGQEKVLATAASSDGSDNRPFTQDEQLQIARQLDEIKDYLISGQQFDRTQSEYIHQEFEYLKSSSRRFGRKDWLRLLLGVLVGQAVTLALSPEKARGLMHAAGTTFQWMWTTAQGFLH
jgi:hypothetical protein